MEAYRKSDSLGAIDQSWHGPKVDNCEKLLRYLPSTVHQVIEAIPISAIIKNYDYKQVFSHVTMSSTLFEFSLSLRKVTCS